MATDNFFEHGGGTEQGDLRAWLRSLPRANAPADTESRLRERVAAEQLGVAAELAHLPRAAAHPDFEKRLMRRIGSAEAFPRRFPRVAGVVFTALVIVGTAGTGYLLYTNNNLKPLPDSAQRPATGVPDARPQQVSPPQQPIPASPAPATQIVPPPAPQKYSTKNNGAIPESRTRKKRFMRSIPGHAPANGHGGIFNKNPKPQNHTRKPRA